RIPVQTSGDRLQYPTESLTLGTRMAPCLPSGARPRYSRRACGRSERRVLNVEAAGVGRHPDAGQLLSYFRRGLVEGGEPGRIAFQFPVFLAVYVKPDEANEVISRDGSEQAGDLRRLVTAGATPVSAINTGFLVNDRILASCLANTE